MNQAKSSAVAALLHPLAWLSPRWVIGCGVRVSGPSSGGRWPIIGVLRRIAGMVVGAFALRGAGTAR
jgi:hypothetical protein